MLTFGSVKVEHLRVWTSESPSVLTAGPQATVTSLHLNTIGGRQHRVVLLRVLLRARPLASTLLGTLSVSCTLWQQIHKRPLWAPTDWDGQSALLISPCSLSARPCGPAEWADLRHCTVTVGYVTLQEILPSQSL